MNFVKVHKDLVVYQKAFSAAMEIYHLSKSFPKEETYSLTDQIRRSSRSVNANITEAWRKRRYKNLLSTNSMMQMEKQPKPKIG